MTTTPKSKPLGKSKSLTSAKPTNKKDSEEIQWDVKKLQARSRVYIEHAKNGYLFACCCGVRGTRKSSVSLGTWPKGTHRILFTTTLEVHGLESALEHYPELAEDLTVIYLDKDVNGNPITDKEKRFYNMINIFNSFEIVDGAVGILDSMQYVDNVIQQMPRVLAADSYSVTRIRDSYFLQIKDLLLNKFKTSNMHFIAILPSKKSWDSDGVEVEEPDFYGKGIGTNFAGAFKEILVIQMREVKVKLADGTVAHKKKPRFCFDMNYGKDSKMLAGGSTRLDFEPRVAGVDLDDVSTLPAHFHKLYQRRKKGKQ